MHKRTRLEAAVRKAWAFIGRVAERRKLWPAVLAAGVFVASAIPTLVRRHAPAPEVHDEFSYLLAADTFAHGRATNPTHPMWPSLEALHVFHQPTYQSKYPPAQGVMLAIGQVVGGHPIVGVWLSAALMVGAVGWALLGWVPPRWALLGTLVIAVRAVLDGQPYTGGQLGYWSQSYWGGAVAAAGGALLYGGLRRLLRAPSIAGAVWTGVGVVVLANSRPFEGLLVTLPAAALTVGWLVTRPRERRTEILRTAVLPLLLVGLAGAGLMGWYNHRVTGRATRIPYVQYRELYAVSPQFVWQGVFPAPTYRTEEMRKYHTEWEVASARRPRPVEWVKDTFFLAARALDFLVGSLVAWAAVLMLPWILRDRWSRFAVGAAAVGFGGAFLGTYFFPHYIAPVAFLTAIIAVQGLRRWSLSRIAGWPVGRACVLLVLLLLTVGTVLDWRRDLKGGVRPGYEWAQERASLIRKLEAEGGRHLILVRYGDRHDVNASRIANGADIDGSPVVWAHDLDPATNARLLEYFKDRRAWRMTVDLDSDPPRLEPYPVLGKR